MKTTTANISIESLTDEQVLLYGAQIDRAEHAVRTHTEHMHRAALVDMADLGDQVESVKARAAELRRANRQYVR